MSEVTLRDGTRMTIRPIEPDDRAALAEGFRRLSPESRYRRFFSPVPELRERDLDYLTRVDHHDHEALVAVAPDGDGAGVARYVRTGADVAEPAIVVADDWQGRGVASALLGALVARARAEGIARFETPVLATNADAIRVLSRIGETTRRPAGQEVELTIVLPEAPASESWTRRALRDFAAGTVAPARTVVELLWPRRTGTAADPRRNLVVVGTDGSADAERAVRAATAIAVAADAIVHVVGVHRLLLPDEEEIRAAVTGAASSLRERGLHVHEHLRRGDPALALTQVAADERARLVVVGAGGRTGAARRLLGSVADSVAERSPCDVLIVREPR